LSIKGRGLYLMGKSSTPIGAGGGGGGDGLMEGNREEKKSNGEVRTSGLMGRGLPVQG